jgi:hypothetical protein
VSVAEPLVVAALAAAGSTAAVIAAHWALFWLGRVERRARALVSLFAAGMLAEVVTCRLLGVDGWRTVCGAVLNACAFILYMPFYYTVAASFSVRMLLDLTGAPGGLTRDELAARYPVPAIVTGRLETLCGAGYLRRGGERVALTAKGALTARSFAWVKRFWALGPGG